MKSHLSAEEFSDWLAGARDPGCAEHVAQCGECSCEIGRLEAALSDFREAVGNWSAPPERIAERRPRHAGRWALAAAVAIVLAAGPIVYRHQRHEAEMARADAALLEQVDAEVSEAVPSPMEPLVQMVSWSSASEANGESK